jgi:large subunit ribosomal protein L35
MPKLKTNRAASKRFRKTANGFKRYHSRRRHNLGDKPRKQKRHLRSGGTSLVHESDVGRIVQLMPNAKVSPRKRATPYVAKADRAAAAADAPASTPAKAKAKAKSKAKSKAKTVKADAPKADSK